MITELRCWTPDCTDTRFGYQDVVSIHKEEFLDDIALNQPVPQKTPHPKGTLGLIYNWSPILIFNIMKMFYMGKIPLESNMW